MNPLKTITLALAAIIAIAMMLTVIQRLLRKLPSETDSRIKPAYGVWFVSLFIAACLITAKAVSFLAEAIDNVYKLGTGNLFFELVKISALYIGLSVLWLLLWHYIAKVISVIIFGVRRDAEEMELNNTHYFLVRGTIIVGFIFCLSPVLELLFRAVMPNVPLPFYH